MTEKERSREKFLARVAEEREAREARKLRQRRKYRERVASREEQHASYLDCGPQAWDDR